MCSDESMLQIFLEKFEAESQSDLGWDRRVWSFFSDIAPFHFCDGHFNEETSKIAISEHTFAGKMR